MILTHESGSQEDQFKEKMEVKNLVVLSLSGKESLCVWPFVRLSWEQAFSGHSITMTCYFSL
jgi:hypothetical protein